MESRPATLLVSLLIWIAPLSVQVFAQPATANGDANCKGSGINPLSNFFGRIAASQGSQTVQAPLVAQGMCQLSKIMQQNGGDPQRAMMTFVQTPDGQALMWVPGAYQELLEDFHKVVSLPTSLPPKAGAQ